MSRRYHHPPSSPSQDPIHSSEFVLLHLPDPGNSSDDLFSIKEKREIKTNNKAFGVPNARTFH